MSIPTVFTIDDKFNQFSEKLNIDTLFEQKQRRDMAQVTTFNKILNKIHLTIKRDARNPENPHLSWYRIPERMLGVAYYDQALCIAYVMDKLQQSHFAVRYVHPNIIMISWAHWCPAHVREQIKRKTGITVNEFGQVIPEPEEETAAEATVGPAKKEYKSTQSYRPSGIYDAQLFQRMENRMT